MGNWEVLSLGGSLVCPEKIDFEYLREFKRFVLKWLKKRKRFIIFVGGGNTAREYQKSAKDLRVSNKVDLDWIGIYATFLNATIVRTIFGDIALPQIITDPTQKIRTNKKVIIGGGWKPGRSTDYDAVLMAKTMGVKRVVNLSNIDVVYDKDPKKFDDAKPLRQISFNQLLKITGRKWIPGANLPFDPIAAKLAQREKIEIIVLNGRNLKNLDNLLNKKDFIGTRILE